MLTLGLVGLALGLFRVDLWIGVIYLLVLTWDLLVLSTCYGLETCLFFLVLTCWSWLVGPLDILVVTWNLYVSNWNLLTFLSWLVCFRICWSWFRISWPWLVDPSLGFVALMFWSWLGLVALVLIWDLIWRCWSTLTTCLPLFGTSQPRLEIYLWIEKQCFCPISSCQCTIVAKFEGTLLC